MAKRLTNIPTNLTEYPNSFKRQGAFPLEAYELFYNENDAINYAKNGPTAYVGQTIKVVTDSGIDTYLITDEDGTLEILNPNYIIIDGGTAQDVISTLPGDVNGDGVVDNKDLTLLLRYVEGWDVEFNKLTADVYQDGIIDDKDLRVLLAHLSDRGAPFDNLPVLPTEVSEEELPNLTSAEV